MKGPIPRLLGTTDLPRPNGKPATTPLVFRSADHAFDYACKFMRATIQEERTVVAQILDASEASAALSICVAALNEGDNDYIAYPLRVASDDGGFENAGLCYRKDASLRTDDLVYWVPLRFNHANAFLLRRHDAGWVGGIVARLRPILDLESGFEIAEEYHQNGNALA